MHLSQHFHQRSLCCFLVTSICLLCPSAVVAQNRAPEMKPLTGGLAGTLMGIIPAKKLIQLETLTKENWLVLVTDKTKIHVVGEAGPEVLAPGMTLQFYARMTQKGLVESPLKEVKVITLIDGIVLGAILEEEEGQEEGEAEEDEKKDGESPKEEKEDTVESESTGGFDGVIGAGTEPEENPAKRSRVKPKETKRAIPYQRYWVTGVLTGVKKNKLTIQVGSKKIKCEIDPEAKVAIEVSDLRFAKQGDTISVAGSYAQKGYAQARTVDVTIVPKATEEKKLPTRKQADAKDVPADKEADKPSKPRDENAGAADRPK